MRVSQKGQISIFCVFLNTLMHIMIKKLLPVCMIDSF